MVLGCVHQSFETSKKLQMAINYLPYLISDFLLIEAYYVLHTRVYFEIKNILHFDILAFHVQSEKVHSACKTYLEYLSTNLDVMRQKKIKILINLDVVASLSYLFICKSWSRFKPYQKLVLSISVAQLHSLNSNLCVLSKFDMTLSVLLSILQNFPKRFKI